MKQIEGTSLLITISEDLPNEPILKVWALDNIDKKTGSPRCLSTLSVQNGRRPFPVCFSNPPAQGTNDNEVCANRCDTRYPHLQLLTTFLRSLSVSQTGP